MIPGLPTLMTRGGGGSTYWVITVGQVVGDFGLTTRGWRSPNIGSGVPYGSIVPFPPIWKGAELVAFTSFQNSAPQFAIWGHHPQDFFTNLNAVGHRHYDPYEATHTHNPAGYTTWLWPIDQPITLVNGSELLLILE